MQFLVILKTVLKAQETIAEIKRRLVEQFQPQAIILFGSHAWGQPREESDIDLLILKESDQDKHRMGVEVQKILHDIDCSLDLLVYKPSDLRNKQQGFFNKILSEGTWLYGSA